MSLIKFDGATRSIMDTKWGGYGIVKVWYKYHYDYDNHKEVYEDDKGNIYTREQVRSRSMNPLVLWGIEDIDCNTLMSAEEYKNKLANLESSYSSGSINTDGSYYYQQSDRKLCTTINGKTTCTETHSGNINGKPYEYSKETNSDGTGYYQDHDPNNIPNSDPNNYPNNYPNSDESEINDQYNNNSVNKKVANMFKKLADVTLIIIVACVIILVGIIIIGIICYIYKNYIKKHKYYKLMVEEGTPSPWTQNAMIADMKVKINEKLNNITQNNIALSADFNKLLNADYKKLSDQEVKYTKLIEEKLNKDIERKLKGPELINKGESYKEENLEIIYTDYKEIVYPCIIQYFDKNLIVKYFNPNVEPMFAPKDAVRVATSIFTQTGTQTEENVKTHEIGPDGEPIFNNEYEENNKSQTQTKEHNYTGSESVENNPYIDKTEGNNEQSPTFDEYGNPIYNDEFEKNNKSRNKSTSQTQNTAETETTTQTQTTTQTKGITGEKRIKVFNKWDARNIVIKGIDNLRLQNYLYYDCNSSVRNIVSLILLNKYIFYKDFDSIEDIKDYISFARGNVNNELSILKIIVNDDKDTAYKNSIYPYNKKFDNIVANYINKIYEFQETANNIFKQECNDKLVEDICDSRTIQYNIFNNIINKIETDILNKNKEIINKIDDFFYEYGVLYTVFGLLMINIIFKFTILQELYYIYVLNKGNEVDEVVNNYYSTFINKVKEHPENKCEAFDEFTNNLYNIFKLVVNNNEDISDNVIPINSEIYLYLICKIFKDMKFVGYSSDIENNCDIKVKDILLSLRNGFIDLNYKVFINTIINKYINYMKSNNIDYTFKQHKRITNLIHSILNYCFASHSVLYLPALYTLSVPMKNIDIIDYNVYLFKWYSENYCNKFNYFNDILPEPYDIQGLERDIYETVKQTILNNVDTIIVS